MKSAEPIEVKVFPLQATSEFPNNSRCPLLVYPRAFDPEAGADAIEQRFAEHGWTKGWRAGVYSTHHYHSTAHEVLGCFAGSAELQVGGPSGPSLTLSAGDVVVIPAGVAHRKLNASGDFCVVGAYADGRDYDMNYGKAAERSAAERNLTAVPLPQTDPVAGSGGPLAQHWRP